MLGSNQANIPLSEAEILNIRNNLRNYDYEVLTKPEKIILAIRTDRDHPNLMEDLENVYHQLEQRDTFDLTHVCLIGNENVISVKPDIITALMNRRMEDDNVLVSELRSKLSRDFESHIFKDHRDPSDIIRFVVRVPYEEISADPSMMFKIFSNVTDEIEGDILYVIADSNFIRLTRRSAAKIFETGDRLPPASHPGQFVTPEVEVPIHEPSYEPVEPISVRPVEPAGFDTPKMQVADNNISESLITTPPSLSDDRSDRFDLQSEFGAFLADREVKRSGEILEPKFERVKEGPPAPTLDFKEPEDSPEILVEELIPEPEEIIDEPSSVEPFSQQVDKVRPFETASPEPTAEPEAEFEVEAKMEPEVPELLEPTEEESRDEFQSSELQDHEEEPEFNLPEPEEEFKTLEPKPAFKIKIKAPEIHQPEEIEEEPEDAGMEDDVDTSVKLDIENILSDEMNDMPELKPTTTEFDLETVPEPELEAEPEWKAEAEIEPEGETASEELGEPELTEPEIHDQDLKTMIPDPEPEPVLPELSEPSETSGKPPAEPDRFEQPRSEGITGIIENALEETGFIIVRETSIDGVDVIASASDSKYKRVFIKYVDECTMDTVNEMEKLIGFNFADAGLVIAPDIPELITAFSLPEKVHLFSLDDFTIECKERTLLTS